MSRKTKNKINNLQDELRAMKTAIGLRCVDCQGYELTKDGCGMHNCPLYPFQPKKGATINKEFLALVSKFQKLLNDVIDPSEGYWQKEFENLNFRFKNKNLKRKKEEHGTE